MTTIAPSTKINPTIVIGEYCVIGENVNIGTNVRIKDYCEIRDNCEIGDNTTFGSRCTLAAGTIVGKNCELKYGLVCTDTPRLGEKQRKPCIIEDEVKIGANVTVMPGVTIHKNAVIGACSQVRHDVPEGETWFGNPAGPGGALIEDGAKVINGVYVKSEGGVKIGSRVRFQSHVSVKRGLDKDTYTVIGDGTYVCSFANIGHNVKIGKDCFIAVGAKILGNAILGDHVYVGANAVIVNRKKIGSWVKIRAGEVVNQDLPDNVYYGKDGKIVSNQH